jgi:hypothetical protein
MKKRKMRRKYERKVKGRGYNDNVRINYDRRQPTFDYLKYFRVIRYWAKRNHELGLADMEMLFFLYSERLFKRSDFNEYSQIFPWDSQRFEKLRRNGWISKWREKRGSEPALYEVSAKGKRVVGSFYRKLAGEEKISETPHKNPIFKKNSPFTDKVYRRAIKNMNKSIEQQQRPSQE